MKKLIFLLAALCTVFRAGAAQSDAVLETPTAKIYGTLLVPDLPAPVPLVVIVAGSGPTDRNGNNSQMTNNSLKMLAEAFEAQGIASLRYDKRLIAASAGQGLSEADVTLDDYIADARGWVGQYAEDERFSKIFIAGHSEGALIAIVAAQDNPAVAGVIALAGAGRPLDAVVKEQLATLPDALRQSAFATIDSLKAGRTTDDFDPMLAALFRPSVQPFLISCFKYDPAAQIAGLQIPILVVQGTTDIQVSVTDAELLAAANPRVEKLIISDMNHVLKQCASIDRLAQMAVYMDPALPLDEQLTKACVAFVRGE